MRTMFEVALVLSVGLLGFALFNVPFWLMAGRHRARSPVEVARYNGSLAVVIFGARMLPWALRGALLVGASAAILGCGLVALDRLSG